MVSVTIRVCCRCDVSVTLGRYANGADTADALISYSRLQIISYITTAEHWNTTTKSTVKSHGAVRKQPVTSESLIP